MIINLSDIIWNRQHQQSATGLPPVTDLSGLPCGNTTVVVDHPNISISLQKFGLQPDYASIKARVAQQVKSSVRLIAVMVDDLHADLCEEELRQQGAEIVRVPRQVGHKRIDMDGAVTSIGAAILGQGLNVLAMTGDVEIVHCLSLTRPTLGLRGGLSVMGVATSMSAAIFREPIDAAVVMGADLTALAEGGEGRMRYV